MFTRYRLIFTLIVIFQLFSTQANTCVSGYYAAGTGNVECLRCPAGKWTNNVGGATSCASCPPGPGSANVNCVINGYMTCSSKDLSGCCNKSLASPYAEACTCNSGQRMNSCTDCNLNNTTKGGYAAWCEPCPLGQMKPYSSTRQWRCVDCPVGYYSGYSIEKNNGKCSICPQGKFSNSG